MSKPVPDRNRNGVLRNGFFAVITLKSHSNSVRMYSSLSQTNRLSLKAKSDDLEIHGSSTCRFDHVYGFWFLFDSLRSLRRRSHCDVAVRVEFLTPEQTTPDQ